MGFLEAKVLGGGSLENPVQLIGPVSVYADVFGRSEQSRIFLTCAE